MFRRIQAAQKLLQGQANRTPVMTSRTLDGLTGAKVLLKCENFQRVGAFKFRGAFNAVSRLAPEQKERGAITYSSGNHGQALALVGRLLGVRTTVVMPCDAPAIKRAATEGYGARVVEYDPCRSSRQEVAERLAAEHGYTVIPPFDHEDVIAGQGTAAVEFLQETGGLDQLLVPCGGGGLLSGCAVAAKNLFPSCRVVGIEPQVADDATRSFQTGTLQTVHNPPTMADGVRTASLGKLTFPLILRHVDAMATVTEAAIAEAVRFLFYRMKLVVEPSGALGVAALLCREVDPRGKVGIVLSGGNIDGSTLIRILDPDGSPPGGH